jgi:para-aminobenzoate synthetase component 1
MSLLKHPLPYRADSAALFGRLSHKPWAVFLDSGQPGSQYGRFDIIVADPFITLCTIETIDGVQTEVLRDGKTILSDEDPFALLAELMEPYNVSANGHPFTGGAVGYFSYDLARQVEHLPEIARKSTIPHMQVGIYDWALVVDHREKVSYLLSNGLHADTHTQWPALCAFFENPAKAEQAKDFKLTSHVTSNMNFEQYAYAFNTIKQYITEGDCYQVNLAQRFVAKVQGHSWQAYQKLREISPAPFMSFMNFGDLQVLSGSPERFLQVTGRHVETRPIKGTRPRANDATLDKQYALELQSSSKDRAENLMIVDLLRNDISKNCEIGSVKANTLFQLQSFANVHHLVSFVTGKLRTGKTALDLLRGCFPGGSITGAPKLRAMQIIEELEGHRRGVYCGAIGYIGFDGNMDTNIAIRTAVCTDDEISFYAGGGIVADSELEKEYAETLDKASSMLKTMQYFQGSDEGFYEKK